MTNTERIEVLENDVCQMRVHVSSNVKAVTCFEKGHDWHLHSTYISSTGPAYNEIKFRCACCGKEASVKGKFCNKYLKARRELDLDWVQLPLPIKDLGE